MRFAKEERKKEPPPDLLNPLPLGICVKQEFIAPLILSALNDLQNQHTFGYSNLTVYSDLKANELLGEYAKIAWN